MLQLSQVSRKTCHSPHAIVPKSTLRYFQHALPRYGRPGGRPPKTDKKGVGNASAKVASNAALKSASKPRRKSTTKASTKKLTESTSKFDDKLVQLENKFATELFYANAHNRQGARPLGDKNRMNIVSEGLCEDVISRLSPSLQKHMNCDIIDINPGIGLFSSKLHEVLKPRTHVLMEPDETLYMQYLQPLLDQENSKYRFLPSSGVIWANLDKFEKDKMLPKQELLSKGDPRLEQKNDTLLMVANLGYYPAKPYMGFPSVTSLMIHQLLSAVRAHALFQGYGLVRMLVWMLDKEKKQVLPRVVTQRRKSTLEAEIACENIFEIAGSDELVANDRREHGIDLESARMVGRRMEEANITTPSGRVGSLQAEAANASLQSENSTSSVIRPFVKELADLKARYARHEFPACYDANGDPVYVDLDDPKKTLTTRKYALTPEYDRLCKLLYRTASVNTKTARVDLALEEYEEIVGLLEGIQGHDPVATSSQRAALHKRLEEWESDVSMLTGNLASQVWQRLEDRRLFRQDPSVLLWDRRPAEPLKVEATEFFPQQDMCLLDFHPKPTWSIFNARAGNLTNYDDFEFMLTGLFITPTQSIVRGMTAAAPGAAEWILPRCPSLTDPTRGGAVDLEHLSVRSLSADMFREIFEAWMDWPFRPSKSEMLVRLGSQSMSDDDDDDGRFSGIASV
ncbi:MAG: hypothetical protein M1818_003039 [Claussenomyces sp. TS43310]|nr:MAG: hypothetical protein M1818_003039 [Claussenomyces sp. TS43310]